MIPILSRLIWLYMKFLYWTSSFRWVGKQHEDILREGGRPYLIAFWHNRQAYLLEPYRNRKIAILISPSKDGEIIAQTAKCFGVPSVRGSSRKEPAKALRALLKAVRAGFSPAITPDGPIGPAREVKPGAVYLAQALELPILPLAAASSRKIVFNSWDKFIFPLPFSRIVLGCGEPLIVKQGDDLDKKSAELKAALDAITDQTDALAV